MLAGRLALSCNPSYGGLVSGVVRSARRIRGGRGKSLSTSTHGAAEKKRSDNRTLSEEDGITTTE